MAIGKGGEILGKLVFMLILGCSGINAETDHRVVGGRPAIAGEFPHQVSLRRSYNDDHFCGGSIISPKFVLTAAHCMFYRWGGVLPPIVVSVVAGQLDLPIKENAVYRNASRIIVHPNFKSASMANDFALIEVDQPFPVVNNPQVAAIEMTNTSVSSGTCVVSGWGRESVDSPEIISTILLAAEVDVITIEKCQEMYAKDNISLDSGSMLCAGHVNGETDACQGDSGGPLTCSGFLVGVVSTGKGCGNAKYPGIYADIYKFLDWIEENAVESPSATEIPTTTTSVKPAPPDISTVVEHFINFISSMFDKMNLPNSCGFFFGSAALLMLTSLLLANI